MSEDFLAASDAEPQELATAQARLQAWRQGGASRADPLRFHFLEALARRSAASPESLRRRLLPRLAEALDDYARRLDAAQHTAAEEAAQLAAQQPALGRQLRALQTLGDVRSIRLLAARPGGPVECAPLAQLNRHIREASPAVQSAEHPGRADLASARRFQRTWSRGRSQEQLALAVSRKPVNAGPLNSHALVLQSLDLMQELSADYLRHFIAHVEALQWLEMARDAPAPEAARPAGKSARSAKGAKPASTAKTSKARSK